MADIILAEFNGCVWLVGGEPLIDDLLANTLAPGITIEVVPCEHKSDVKRLWHDLCGERPGWGEPWIIHPAIADRARRTLSVSTVNFAEWSAAIDAQGHIVIAGMAARLAGNDTATVDLVEFLDADAPKSAADLCRVRAQLIEEALVAAGVAPGRIGRSRQAPGDAGSQRIEIAWRD
jgi:hypothetical protein